jgi:cAMP-dependent protein kinase regulator
MAQNGAEAAQNGVEPLALPQPTKKYISNVLDPVLMEMVQAVIDDLPDEPLEFVIEWLRKRGGVTGPIEGCAVSLQEQNAKLKRDLNCCRGSQSEIVDAIADTKDKSESEEEDDDDDAAFEEEAKKALAIKAKQTGPRQSVSAEAYGDWNVKKEFKAPVFEKTDEQKVQLRKILDKSFLFSNLSAEATEIIVNAMEQKTFAAGERIITEGEDGYDLFIIEEGTPECSKLIDGVKKVVKTCAPGDVFGELALLYNCARAATVETQERSLCWRLDRETFNAVVREAAVARSAVYDTFLKEVPLLISLGDTDRLHLVDALKCDTFSEGYKIVTQGEPGDRFYMVEDGSLAALINIPGEDEPQKVKEFTRSTYFGELALLRNQPRTATVVVTSASAKVVSIDRACFLNLVGSVADVLNKHIDSYNGIPK